MSDKVSNEYLSNVKDASNKSKDHYSDKFTIREKWIREYGRLSIDNTDAENWDSVSEIFKLVETVSSRKIDEFRNKATRRENEIKDDKVYEVYDDNGKIIKFWPPNDFNTRMEALRRIGYKIPLEVNKEIRPERNADSHNPRTVVMDLIDADYEKSKEKILLLADCLVAFGELNDNDKEPTFEQMRIREGSFLRNGEYEIGQLLGEGGMSRVYLSSHKRLGKKLAIKELKPQECHDIMGSECNILCELKHPNIPQVYDTFAQNGTYYIVMEYVDGVTLDKYIERDLTFDEKKDICLKLCDIMTYLHSEETNVIFADMKPQNIIIDKTCKPYLIDFGIAKVEDETVVRDGKIALTGKYTAPEVYEGKRDKLSDVYSFGMVLRDIFAENPDDVIDEIIDKCTKQNPMNRYASFQEVRNALILSKSDILQENKTIELDQGSVDSYNDIQKNNLKKKRKFVPLLITLAAVVAGIAISVGVVAGIGNSMKHEEKAAEAYESTMMSTITESLQEATEVNEIVEQTESKIAVKFESQPVTTMNGNAVIEVIDISREKSTVDVKITNYLDTDIKPFGFPSVVINGNSVALDPYKNMSNSNINVAPNSSTVITYYVESSFFESGGRIVGKMWSINPTITNNDYDINVKI